MSQINHPHPGEIIRDEVLIPLELSIQEMSTKLGVSSELLEQVLQGHMGVNKDLACSLEQAGFSTARFWVALQTEYDKRSV